jgi:hypothetical protein
MATGNLKSLIWFADGQSTKQVLAFYPKFKKYLNQQALL